jgi:vancomycin resistance protein YoaR
VVASHTSRFESSPPERVTNIVNSANAVNNFFNDWRHPFVRPRDSLSLIWLLGDISIENGYVWGHAIGTFEGRLVDIPAIGGGICQLPSTIFPAVMKAGLDVTTRYNHRYYPYFWWNYPEGFGWDATIQPPWTDFVWRNLYDYPVRLFMRADLANWTLTAEVWAPPELVPYATTVDGPFLVNGSARVPTDEAGWVWWASTTVITQRTVLDGRAVPRSFWSYYGADPHWVGPMY